MTHGFLNIQYFKNIFNSPSPVSNFLIGAQFEPKNNTDIKRAIHPTHMGVDDSFELDAIKERVEATFEELSIENLYDKNKKY